jgi:hypothetical protein
MCIFGLEQNFVPGSVAAGPTARATETAEQPAVCLRNVVEAENLQFDRDGHGAVSSSMADSLDCAALTTSEQPSTVGDWYTEPSTEAHATGSQPPRETQGRCSVSTMTTGGWTHVYLSIMKR